MVQRFYPHFVTKKEAVQKVYRKIKTFTDCTEGTPMEKVVQFNGPL